MLQHHRSQLVLLCVSGAHPASH